MKQTKFRLALLQLKSIYYLIMKNYKKPTRKKNNESRNYGLLIY